MSDGWVGEGRVRYCEIASPMRNVTSRTANYAHSFRRNDYETLSPLFPLFPSFASVTCRSDRLGSVGCLPRNGGATFWYRTIPRFINIHSWKIYMYHLLKRSSLLRVDQTPFLSNVKRAPTGRNTLDIPNGTASSARIGNA